VLDDGGAAEVLELALRGAGLGRWCCPAEEGGRSAVTDQRAARSTTLRPIPACPLLGSSVRDPARDLFDRSEDAH
jgi:hypothetical protein